MEKRSVAVCSGYYGFNNFGDEAVLSVLLETFSDKYECIVCSSNPKETESSHGVKSIYSFDYLRVLQEIKKADVFISGGGSLLQDVTSFKSLVYYLLLIYWALLCRKKVIIFAQGLGPFRLAVSKVLVRYALNLCDLVTVRDIESKILLDSWKVKSTQVCDPVFVYPIKLEKRPATVGVQLRDFLGVNEVFLKNLAEAINKNFSDKKVLVYPFQSKLDKNVCERFMSLLKVPEVELREGLDIKTLADEISSLEYLIAMRFHAVLLGLRAGVKVLPISYDDKVRILSEQVGINYEKLESYDFNSSVAALENYDIERVSNKISCLSFDKNIFDI